MPSHRYEHPPSLNPMRGYDNSITGDNWRDIRNDIRELKLSEQKINMQVDALEKSNASLRATTDLFSDVDQRILKLEEFIETNQSTDSEARKGIIDLTELNLRTFDTMSKRILKLEEFINMHQNSQPRSPSLYHDSFVIPRTSSSSSSSVGSMRKGIRIKRTHKKRTNRKRTHKKRTHRKRNSRKRPHKNR